MLTVRDRPPAHVDVAAARPHAVVIGSGFGGLAAAIRLGARGYHVTVLERLDCPGGRAGVLKRDGFTFDRGPTIVTAPFLFEELWQLCGRRMADHVDLRPMQPFYRIRFHDGDEIACSGDDAEMHRQVLRVSPSDLPGYERFLKKARAICAKGFEELGGMPFGSPLDMLKIAPDLVRLEGYRSVHGLVSRFVKNPKLRTMLSFHPLLIGGNPFRAPAIYCLIPDLERRWGVHYPMGGVGRLQNTTSASSATAAGVAATLIELPGRSAAASGLRSWTMTWWPASASRLTMGAPMRPSPTNPSVRVCKVLTPGRPCLFRGPWASK